MCVNKCYFVYNSIAWFSVEKEGAAPPMTPPQAPLQVFRKGPFLCGPHFFHFSITSSFFLLSSFDSFHTYISLVWCVLLLELGLVNHRQKLSRFVPKYIYIYISTVTKP